MATDLDEAKEEYMAINQEGKTDEEKEEEHLYTYDDALDKIGVGWYQLLLIQVMGAGYFFDGMELTMISFIIPYLTEQWQMSPVAGGALESVVFLGMGVGAYCGGLISDRFGRRIIYLTSVLIVATFGVASAFSPNYVVFLILRIFLGVGLGAMVPTDFSYTMEFTPRQHRGAMLTVLQLYNCIGALFVCLLAWICLTHLPNDTGWRYLIGIGAAPGFLIFAGRLFAPESPRFMLVRGRYEEARAVLYKIAKVNRAPVLHGRLLAPHPGHQLTIRQQVVGIFGRNFWRLTLSLFVIWFCTSYGGWGFTFLIPIVFKKIGTDQFVATGITQAVTIVSYVILLFTVDRIPRRAIMGVVYLLAMVNTVLIGVSTNDAYVITLSAMANFLINIPWAVLYIYTPEAFPTTLRALGMGSCSAVTRIAGTITPLCGTALLQISSYLPFVTFGLALGVAGVVSFFLPFETMGTPLEDVAYEYKNYDMPNEVVKAGVKEIEEDIVRLGSPHPQGELEEGLLAGEPSIQ